LILNAARQQRVDAANGTADVHGGRIETCHLVMNTIWFLLIMLEPALLQFSSPTKASGWRSARREREGTVTTDGMRHPPPRTRFASHASAAQTLDCARHALDAIRVTIVSPHRFKRCGLCIHIHDGVN
jgi:hypothetical protein